MILRWISGKGIVATIRRNKRREIFSGMLDAFDQTTDLNAEAINVWGYTIANGVDINDTYSLRKQIGKILDYVYETIGEDNHIRNLIASRPNNEKFIKLARHLREAPEAG